MFPLNLHYLINRLIMSYCSMILFIICLFSANESEKYTNEMHANIFRPIMQLKNFILFSVQMM